MMPTASHIEILQLVVACVGLGFALWGIWSSIKDAMKTTREEPRRILAMGHIRSQFTRVAVHAMLVFAGAASVSLPPPPPTYETEQAFIIRLVMVIVTMILSLDYALDRRVRFVFNNHPWFKNPPPQGAS